MYPPQPRPRLGSNPLARRIYAHLHPEQKDRFNPQIGRAGPGPGRLDLAVGLIVGHVRGDTSATDPWHGSSTLAVCRADIDMPSLQIHALQGVIGGASG